VQLPRRQILRARPPVARARVRVRFRARGRQWNWKLRERMPWPVHPPCIRRYATPSGALQARCYLGGTCLHPASPYPMSTQRTGVCLSVGCSILMPVPSSHLHPNLPAPTPHPPLTPFKRNFSDAWPPLPPPSPTTPQIAAQQAQFGAAYPVLCAALRGYHTALKAQKSVAREWGGVGGGVGEWFCTCGCTSAG
jgi:hypothetical protein